MITPEIKTRVITGLQTAKSNFGGTDSKFATSLGINAAQLSRVLKGDHDKVLSDASWLSIARKLQLPLFNEKAWKTAQTPVYTYISQMLGKCQHESISALICDAADIGKTYTAKEYCKSNKNAIYIDCSQVKTKQKLVRAIAKEFGVNYTGRYSDVYADLVYYLTAIATPVIVLDEAGDLAYEAFLELKALWNATEGYCGWCLMGADGLKEKIRRAIDNKKVGYTEIFSRYGKRYQRITPEGREEQERFTKQQAALIIQANAPQADIQKMLRNTEGSLRRIKNELSKIPNT